MQGLKHLQKQVLDLSRRLSLLISKQDNYALEILRAKRELDKYEKRAENYEKETSKTDVSDHAVIRYLQRVYKLNLDDVKKEILPDELKVVTRTMKFGKFNRVVAGISFTIVVRNNLVVTVLDE